MEKCTFSSQSGATWVAPTEYEKLFKLPVQNYAFELIGDKTQERLIVKSATIGATWNRVGLRQEPHAPPARAFNATPTSVCVNRALTQ